MLRRIQPGRWPGAWRVHRPHAPWMECLITADPAAGTGGDPSTAQIFCRNARPRWLHLATFEGQIDPFEFAGRLKRASDWHACDGRAAEIAAEDDGLGLALVGKLRELRARQIWNVRASREGWHTGPAGWAVPFESLIKAEADDLIEILDRRTLLQFYALQNERNRSGEIVPTFPSPRDPEARRNPERSRSGDLVKTAAMAAHLLLTQRSRGPIGRAAEPGLVSVSLNDEMEYWRRGSGRGGPIRSTWDIPAGTDMQTNR